MLSVNEQREFEKYTKYGTRTLNMYCLFRILLPKKWAGKLAATICVLLKDWRI